MTLEQLMSVSADYIEVDLIITAVGVQAKYEGEHVDFTLPQLRLMNIGSLTNELEGFIEQTDENNGA